MDYNEIVQSLRATLAQDDLLKKVSDTRISLHESHGIIDYEDIWFCYQIAPGSLGIHQWAEAADFFGIKIDDDEQPEWIWDDIFLESDLLTVELNKTLDADLPSGCHFSIGHWEGGGCYGIVLGYNYCCDIHTVHFLKDDYQKLQRLKKEYQNFPSLVVAHKIYKTLEDYIV